MSDDLPGKLVLLERDAQRDRYTRSYGIRNPGANVSEGTQAFIQASTIADALVPLYGNAKTIGDNAALANKSLRGLIAYADSIGLIPNQLPPAGSSGFAKVSASVAGGTILAGQICRTTSKIRFKCAVTGIYGDGAQIPLVAVDLGPVTNLPPGTVLTWDSQPAGIGPTCVVLAQSDGAGLSGGRDEETQDELLNRIRDRQENPPAAGNDAAFQSFIENFPGLAIQKAFSYPAINGCGSSGLCWTMRPSQAGASRIPNAVQISQVQAGLAGAFPADDSDFFCTLVDSLLNLSLKASWSKAAIGWNDPTPWPVFTAGDLVIKDAAGVSTPTAFRLTTSTAQVDPQIGQVIGFYDRSVTVPVFRRKQIKTVTNIIATKSWDLTFETANNASDATFTPATGDPASPWSDSLSLLVTPVLLYMDQLGPGEQVASFYDAGLRQRRQPEDPDEWTSQITGRLQTPLYALSAIKDVSILAPTLPFLTPVGTPGVSSNLLKLGTFAVFNS